MRILYCNKYNYPFSGTESYLFELMRKMEERGHETALFSMDHGHEPAFTGRRYLIPYLNFKDGNASLLKKVRMAAHAVYSRSARQRMRDCLREYSPDLAHIRGIYHHLSPSILWELKRQGVPVLYHLNDFKMLCPNYNLVAHGHPCERCGRRRLFSRLDAEGAIQGPAPMRAVLAVEAYFHKWLRTYERCVDLFLAPSQFVRSKLIAAGFSAHKIEVLPHFQTLPAEERIKAEEGYVLYFGRLSPEKGVSELSACDGAPAAHSSDYRRRWSRARTAGMDRARLKPEKCLLCRCGTWRSTRGDHRGLLLLDLSLPRLRDAGKIHSGVVCVGAAGDRLRSRFATGTGGARGHRIARIP